MFISSNTIVPFPEGYARRERMMSGVIIIIIIIANIFHHLSFLFNRCLSTPVLRRRGGHWRSIAHAAGLSRCDAGSDTFPRHITSAYRRRFYSVRRRLVPAPPATRQRNFERDMHLCDVI